MTGLARFFEMLRLTSVCGYQFIKSLFQHRFATVAESKVSLKKVPKELVVNFVVILHFRRFDECT